MNRQDKVEQANSRRLHLYTARGGGRVSHQLWREDPPTSLQHPAENTCDPSPRGEEDPDRHTGEQSRTQKRYRQSHCDHRIVVILNKATPRVAVLING